MCSPGEWADTVKVHSAFSSGLMPIVHGIICEGKTMNGNNSLEIECRGIEANGKFSIENTGRKKDISPEFVIGNLFPSAKTLVITLEDLSQKLINEYHYWLMAGKCI